MTGLLHYSGFVRWAGASVRALRFTTRAGLGNIELCRMTEGRYERRQA